MKKLPQGSRDGAYRIGRLVDHQLEAGLHLQGIQSSDRLAVFALVGVDWYVR